MNNTIDDKKNEHVDSFRSSLFLILMKSSNITERIKFIRTCIWLLFSCPLHSTPVISITVHSMYLCIYYIPEIELQLFFQNGFEQVDLVYHLSHKSNSEGYASHSFPLLLCISPSFPSSWNCKLMHIAIPPFKSARDDFWLAWGQSEHWRLKQKPLGWNGKKK